MIPICVRFAVSWLSRLYEDGLECNGLYPHSYHGMGEWDGPHPSCLGEAGRGNVVTAAVLLAVYVVAI